MTIATQIAETVAEDLARACRARGWDDCRPRVWQGDRTGHARVYTGYRSEHLRVYSDGRIERSQPRMRYGPAIDDMIEADRLAAESGRIPALDHLDALQEEVQP